MPKKWKLLKRYPNIYEYQIKKGKRYGIRRNYVNREGVRDEFTKSGLLTIEDAKVLLTNFERNLYAGKIQSTGDRNVTLEEYFNEVSENKVKTGTWRKVSLIANQNVFNNNLKEPFGKTKISTITRRDYQDFINDLIVKGRSQYYINDINSLMQMLMNHAEMYDVITKNKLRGIIKKGGKIPKDQTIEDIDYRIWMEAVPKRWPFYYTAMVKLFTLGERREEALGLRYESFTFKLDATGQEYCEIKFDTARNAVEINGGALKTDASYRTIVVKGDFCQEIKEMLKESKKIRLEHGQPIDQEQFVLVSMQYGKPLHPGSVNRIFNQVSISCGVHINPHKLRHYFATIAKDNNVSDTAIMHWLGHSKIDMTNSYAKPNKGSILKVFDGIKGSI